MIEEEQRARRLRMYGNGAAALVAAAIVLTVLGAGLHALGPGLVPGHGEWTSAALAGHGARR